MFCHTSAKLFGIFLWCFEIFGTGPKQLWPLTKEKVPHNKKKKTPRTNLLACTQLQLQVYDWQNLLTWEQLRASPTCFFFGVFVHSHLDQHFTSSLSLLLQPPSRRCRHRLVQEPGPDPATGYQGFERVDSIMTQHVLMHIKWFTVDHVLYIYICWFLYIWPQVSLAVIHTSCYTQLFGFEASHAFESPSCGFKLQPP